jgi:hypothetical protein
VSLRKVFASVQTDDADTYMGANVVLAVPPTDGGVSLVMTPANTLFETRPTALTRFQNPASTFAGTVELAAQATLGTKSIQVDRTSVPLTPVTVVESQVDVLGPDLTGTPEEVGFQSAGPIGTTASLQRVIAYPYGGDADVYIDFPAGFDPIGRPGSIKVYVPQAGTVQGVQFKGIVLGASYSEYVAGGSSLTPDVQLLTNSVRVYSFPLAVRALQGAAIFVVWTHTSIGTAGPLTTFAFPRVGLSLYTDDVSANSPYDFRVQMESAGPIIGPFRKPAGPGPTQVTVGGVTATFRDYYGMLYAELDTAVTGDTWTWQRLDYPQIVVGTETVYSYTKVSSTVTGFNGTSFPANGEATVFAANRFVVISDLDEITQTVSNAQTVDCGRVRLSSVRVIGNDGIVINTGYTADLEAGTVTFTNVTGYSQPVTIQHRVEDLALINAMSGTTLSLSRGLSHTYPVGAKVSSALVAGDMFARTNLVFDLATWNGTFSDEPGTEATGTFNFATYPIAVTNRGAITERWAIRFTSSTNFEVIGENVGVIATGNTATACAPLNPNTSAPYFTVPALGWGSGWATGNVLRFNTIGAIYPFWVARSVQPGDAEVESDQFTILIRGDVDTP